LPIVLVNRGVEGRRVSSVLSDEIQGISAAVEHLAGLGHRHIGHVAGPSRLSTGHDRRKSFVAALAQRGIAAPDSFIEEAGSYSIEAGAAAARVLLQRVDTLTAVIAANDLIALGCYDELARRGLRCPEDVSVTGFNDMTFADRFDPPLTTVRIPHRLMGETAAGLLLRQIGGEKSVQSVTLQPELIVRASTASPRAALEIRSPEIAGQAS
jgi:LacI family transcriptional regulator